MRRWMISLDTRYHRVFYVTCAFRHRDMAVIKGNIWRASLAVCCAVVSLFPLDMSDVTSARFDNRPSFDPPSGLYCLLVRPMTMFVIRIVRNYVKLSNVTADVIQTHIARGAQWIFNLSLPSRLERNDRSLALVRVFAERIQST